MGRFDILSYQQIFIAKRSENMRVITGSARGRRLLELAGGETRPTADRVKEGVFNIIQFDIEGRRVLDLFAGTGQLGVEALSRGAAEAVFVEQRRDAARLVTENLKLTGLADRARVVNGDALSYLAGAGERFDIVFIDPPYADRLWESAISAIYRFDILANHGIIVCESPVDQEMPAVKAPLFLHRTYRYGRIKITTYHREEGREA
ncbi:MAG: 16S rRNA (guanine(966)-N(2))-methyltransferase RsmD [Oscillospiraceae bacterium]|nr:16S rRNA (guanine(966)-N(2))-methyltransferase RsmD [Oscillospiraceae bacterium]MCI9562752.1 16S rRNA (guanine(966)-N(2))-methyltransferase RsmD [Oscillospiraceae bacterium]